MRGIIFSMEKRHPNRFKEPDPYRPEGDPSKPEVQFLNDIDRKASQELNEEITQRTEEGYTVRVGKATDLAYKDPQKIEEVFRYLKDQGEKFNEERLKFLYDHESIAALAKWLGKIPLPGRWTVDKWNERVEEILEYHRGNLLYDADQTNSWPWHKQRGSASTFLSIAEAHALAVIDDDKLAFPGKYPTMSGPIDESLFEEKVNGKPLREAMIEAQMNRGESRQQAEQSANERLQSVQEFINAPVTPEFAEIIKYCADGIGIRERKDIVNRQMIEHLKKTAERDESRSINDMLIMSFGCGTALPTLQMMKALKEETGQAPTVILLDQDPLSLAAAQNLARQMGLEDNIEVHCQRLFSKLGRPLGLEKVLKGRLLDIAEDSGLREYLPDVVYRKLTKESWRFLRGGGLMITGNMNENRPQQEFLHGLMGWLPKVTMRKIKRSLELLTESGVPKEAISAEVAPSGVYTIFTAEKS